jgi:hypothetical protein
MSQADILSSIAQVTGVGPKHWQLFDEKSPRGVPMTGYICLQESDYLGALALTSIDGKERFEIIPSMPKIHYPYVEDAREGTVRVSVPLPINVVDVRFTTKLDGTCIIFYALPDEDGHPIEIVPRTRLNPVLTASRWGDWPAMLAKVLPDHSGVERAVRDQKMVLCFELWGYRNPHLVRYDTPLALSFHTAIRRSPGHLASHRTLQDLAGRYGFDLVKSIRVEQPDAVALEAAYRALQAQMEARNQAASEGIFLEEGAVLMVSTRDTATYWKCKPPSIEEIHFTADQALGKDIIKQALLKLAERNYDFANGNVAELHAELEKDFQPPVVEGQAELIQRMWVEFVVELQKRDWLRQHVEQSKLDPRRQTVELMRYLSQHYPKSPMKWVYSSVKAIYG